MTDFSSLTDHLRRAKHVAVLTGAGISAESGVPTFRDAQTGLWAKYDPTELATPQAFARDPKLVWEWYAWRRELVSKAHPNPGHLALAALEMYLAARQAQFTLITQNVDSLHQRAGSANILELHGNISRVKCSVEDSVIDQWESTNESPPRCPHCNHYLRPDVVWFGESLPHTVLQNAVRAAETCDVFFSIGTSGVVEPAASLPFVALRARAFVVEINPQATPLSESASLVVRGAAGDVLPNVMALLTQEN